MHICFLDIDGTLVSTGGAGQAAFVVTLDKDFGIQNATSSGVSFAGRSDRAIAADLMRLLRHRADARSLAASFARPTSSGSPKCCRNTKAACCRASCRCLETLDARGDTALGLITGNVAPSGRAQAASLRTLGLVPLRRLWRRAPRPQRHRRRGTRRRPAAISTAPPTASSS